MMFTRTIFTLCSFALILATVAHGAEDKALPTAKIDRALSQAEGAVKEAEFLRAAENNKKVPVNESQFDQQRIRLLRLPKAERDAILKGLGEDLAEILKQMAEAQSFRKNAVDDPHVREELLKHAASIMSLVSPGSLKKVILAQLGLTTGTMGLAIIGYTLVNQEGPPDVFRAFLGALASISAVFGASVHTISIADIISHIRLTYGTAYDPFYEAFANAAGLAVEAQMPEERKGRYIWVLEHIARQYFRERPELAERATHRLGEVRIVVESKAVLAASCDEALESKAIAEAAAIAVQTLEEVNPIEPMRKR